MGAGGGGETSRREQASLLSGFRAGPSDSRCCKSDREEAVPNGQRCIATLGGFLWVFFFFAKNLAFRHPFLLPTRRTGRGEVNTLSSSLSPNFFFSPLGQKIRGRVGGRPAGLFQTLRQKEGILSGKSSVSNPSRSGPQR